MRRKSAVSPEKRNFVPMDLEKFNRQLKLMSLLAGNTSLNVEQVAQRLGMSRRTVYRYIRTFKESALFSVEQSGDVFRISRDSPFIREISDNVSFSEEEAAVMAGLLASAGGNSMQLRSLRNKIGRIYNYRVLEEPEADRRTARNLSQLYEAVKLHRVAVLKNYHSLHGGSVADRTVEPFAFLNSNDDVRCYELASGENKTFKVARAEEVIVLDLMWSNAGRHESYYTDLFAFSGKETRRVVLRLTGRAARILREERPAAAACLAPADGGDFMLDTRVCDFCGIGRFVLGLHSEVEIVEPAEFKEHIAREAALLTKKFGL